MSNMLSPLLRGAFVLAAVAGLAACAGEPKLVSETALMLGTTCSISLYDRVPAGIFDQAFDRLREIENRWSTVIPTSEVSAVNRSAGGPPATVSAVTVDLVRRSLYFSELSDGAFDITVGPLVNLWGIGTDRARLPAPGEIKSLLPLVDWRSVAVDAEASTVGLPTAHMSIELGGIAKGAAADELVDFLREAGIDRGIIDLGGNVSVIGEKSPGRPWRVGVQDPDRIRGDFIGILHVSDLSVVTSGIYERYFEEGGKNYHHILDTKTGYPVENRLLAVTITAADSTKADALSTAVFALGLEAGMKLIDSLEGVGAIFVTKDKVVHVSPGLRPVYRHTAADYRLAPDENR